MASDRWRASTPLNRLVVEQYGRFNVFQLMRLLIRRGQGADYSAGQRLRFRADLGASFRAAEITRLAACAPRKGGRAQAAAEQVQRIAVHTANYCLAGELGPLPAPFLEWVREQQRDGARAMSAFLDLFNQRIHVLRFELKQRSLRALDPALPADTRYADQLAALMGLAAPGQQSQIPLPKRAWLGMAGLLINTRRSADVVSIVLQRYLGVAVKLHTLLGSWRDIEEGDRLALGRRNQVLGRSSLLGRRVWDSQAAVRLDVARMSFERAVALLPLRPSRAGERLPASRYPSLASLIRLLLDRRYDCEVVLRIDTDSIPAARLTRAGRHLGLRLGQTAWLIHRPVDPHHAGHAESILRFRVNAFAEHAEHTEAFA